jgi:hypothetical protein
MTNGNFLGGLAEGAETVRAGRRASEGLALQREGLALEGRRIDESSRQFDVQEDRLSARLDLDRKAALFKRDQATAKLGIESAKSYRNDLKDVLNQYKTELKALRANPESTPEDEARFRAAFEKGFQPTHASAVSIVDGLRKAGFNNVRLLQPFATLLDAIDQQIPDAGRGQELATGAAVVKAERGAEADIAGRKALLGTPTGDLSAAQQRFLTTGEFPGNVQFETFIEGDERITVTVDENGEREVIARSPASEDKFFSKFISPILKDIQDNKTLNESQQEILDIYMKKSAMEQFLAMALGGGALNAGLGAVPLDSQTNAGQSSFSDMSPEELAKVDLSKLTPEQRAEFGAALDDKGF